MLARVPVRVLLPLVALGLGLAALSGPWWTAEINGEPSSQWGPFQSQGDDDALANDVLFTGVLWAIALLHLAFVVGLEWAGARGLLRILAIAASLAFAAAAIVHATFVWPQESGEGLSFFDETVMAFGPYAFHIETHGDFGWYAAILTCVTEGAYLVALVRNHRRVSRLGAAWAS